MRNEHDRIAVTPTCPEAPISRSRPWGPRARARRAPAAFPVAAAIGLALAACEPSATAPGPPTSPEAAPSTTHPEGPLNGATSLSSLNSNAPFKVWKQKFEHDTEGWVSAADPGPFGWCGSIERVDRRNLDRGDIMPSAGRGYALVRHDDCNAFYDPFFPAGSAPASADPEVLNATFPTGGFVNQVDIYLDPGRPAGDAFGYAVAFQVLDEAFPNFRYSILDVTYTGSAVLVGGEEITEAGWYTFRHRFLSDGGQLGVVFDVLHGGRAVVSEEVPVFLHFLADGSVDVLFTDSFETSNVGSGYIWFVHITGGFPLAIDENQVRRGR